MIAKRKEKKAMTLWTLEQYAQHYALTLARPANGWGQHISPIFGQSHYIMIAARKHYSEEEVNTAFAIKEN